MYGTGFAEPFLTGKKPENKGKNRHRSRMKKEKFVQFFGKSDLLFKADGINIKLLNFKIDLISIQKICVWYHTSERINLILQFR
ncbi:MAG TPA: hypothetical protein DCZ20_03185 [Lachnospiraceae bacterium]|nr:hypothetical protein [Lachnospiraceae bacterium]